jgi:mitochondrial fission protein ELM1
VNQSRGVALWLSRLTNSGFKEVEVPRLSGTRRFLALKVRARSLPTAGTETARKWLLESGGSTLLSEVARLCEGSALSGPELLFLSTGSTAAPYSLALARYFEGRAATVMTPSVLGTRPFDFAIVPAHDCPGADPNVFRTLGAPNAIDKAALEREAEALFERFPPSSAQRWGVLIGGDDANYRIPSDWIRRTIGDLAGKALKCQADLYVTSSRRTSADAEKTLAEISRETSVFRMLLLASKDSSNPVPGILGGCGEIFCTEDSVSMVSEAATAGFAVRLLRVERRGGCIRSIQESASRLVRFGFLPKSFLWGVPRFDAMLEEFKTRGLATETSPWGENGRVSEGELRPEFNEARDAAGWIVREWNNKGGLLS